SSEFVRVGASAVPVLPATLIGNPLNTANEVPLGSFAASYRPCLIADVYGERCSLRTGLKGRRWRTPFRITASPTCGRTTVPPLTSAEYATASCSGLTCSAPWPIARLTAWPSVYGVP